MPLPFLPIICPDPSLMFEHVLFPIMKAAGGLLQPGHANAQAPIYFLVEEDRAGSKFWSPVPKPMSYLTYQQDHIALWATLETQTEARTQLCTTCLRSRQRWCSQGQFLLHGKPPGWRASSLGKNLESTAGTATCKLLGFSWREAELLQGKDSEFSFLSP